MNSKIILNNVCVKIPIYDSLSRSLKDKLLLKPIKNVINFNTTKIGGILSNTLNNTITVSALDDINLSYSEGDRVAILGHNGSGKTTLLRVIAGIYAPSSGSVETVGRIMPLFNMMEGLSLDSKGFEAINLRGSLLGLSQMEIDKRIDGIIEFCELGDFINLPIRTYSTGMMVRLMFAITTCITSDILVMDEFIGAGDAAFFEKAQVRLKNFVDQSKILVVATHSVETAREWCNKAILLDHGKILVSGSTDLVINKFKGG
jgi:ABC-2 type transport system ATP-binding protein/lipopolysaccharide transport system ATP-binding protein